MAHHVSGGDFLVYALTKDARGAVRPGRAVTAAIAITIACVLAAIAGLTGIVTTKTEYLPSFYTDIRFQTPLGNQANVALLLWGAAVLAVLIIRRRTILDLWLMVTLLAYSPNFLVAIIGSSVRFTVGWYAARCFVLVGSCTLLTVLFETMYLYSRLASAVTLQRREGTNPHPEVEAVTGAIAHELRTPLGAIVLNASTALSQLRSTPREREDLENILIDIEADSHRAADMIASIREMTTKTIYRSALTNVEDAAQLALRLLKRDLQINEVSVATDFHGDLPEVQLDGMELQQVLLNLIRNAIDAMSPLPPQARRLRFKTDLDDQSTVVVSVEDSGLEFLMGIVSAYSIHSLRQNPAVWDWGSPSLLTWLQSTEGKLRLLKSNTDGSIFELTMPVGRQRSASMN